MAAFRESIILFGDSITQQSFSPGGWGARLADLFSRKVALPNPIRLILQADIFNRGLSGFTTRSAFPLLSSIFPEQSNQLLTTIFFGANDSCIPGGEFPQHVPLEEYSINLAKIIQHVKKTSKVSAHRFNAASL
jgi:lysophospholipase L1-like esterase